MTKEEHEEILREFSEAKRLVNQLEALTKRIEQAADRAIEAYSNTIGVENAEQSN